MGEFAQYGGREVKIGTCEDMYYLRADQRNTVHPIPGSLDPADKDVLKVIRFRFPWPDEDGTRPGAFENYNRSVAIHGVTAPAGVAHHSVQFVAHAGYVTSLPCPEGGTVTPGVHVHRNGFPGAVLIEQQAFRGGVLALICRCGGCGAKWSVPTLTDADPYIMACLAEADRKERENAGSGAWWRKVAARITAGYDVS